MSAQSYRELLVLAAKAAGVKILDWVDAGPRLTDGISAPVVIWNPLTDDGDALRLAVKLRINIEHAGHVRAGRNGADQVQASPRSLGHLAHVEKYGNDDMAATRFAIVRAAAAIGEQMP